MSLFLHLTIHALLSILVGLIVWRIWGKAMASIASAVMAGVLVDLDHLIDYFIAFGWNFKMDYFLRGYQFLKSDKIYVLLHGWEYVIILLALLMFFRSKIVKSIVLSLALGLFFHLGSDVIVNEFPVKSYSLVYRAKNNFEAGKLLTQENYEEHAMFKKSVGFK